MLVPTLPLMQRPAAAAAVVLNTRACFSSSSLSLSSSSFTSVSRSSVVVKHRYCSRRYCSVDNAAGLRYRYNNNNNNSYSPGQRRYHGKASAMSSSSSSASSFVASNGDTPLSSVPTTPRSATCTSIDSTMTLTVPKSSPFVSSPSSGDFRSDTVTTPSLSQLASLTSDGLSLGDDVYHESTTTHHLCSRVSHLLGKPASLFCSSGTQSNLIALLTHLARSGGAPHSILAPSDSHIVVHEAGGLATLGGCQIMQITPKNGKWITAREVASKAWVGAVGEDVHYAPTKLVSVETTINGVVMPLEEMRAIKRWAEENKVKVHLDGARLWNAAVALADQHGTTPDEMLRDLAACADTVSICLSKGLGAPVGSILVANDDAFITHATRFKKMLGGGMRQIGILTAMGNAAIDEVWAHDKASRIRRTHAIAARIARKWCELGGALAKDTESSMVWLKFDGADEEDMDLVNSEAERWERTAKEEGVTVAYDRIVVHWQITDEAADAVVRAMERFVKEKGARTVQDPEGPPKEAKRVGYRLMGK